MTDDPFDRSPAELSGSSGTVAGVWSSSGRFRMPDGAQIVGQRGDVYEMRISVPLDGDGFFGRQCPACDQLFRVDSDGYEVLPDDVRLWCVYCGHHDEHSEFVTEQQRARALRAVGDLGIQLVGQALDKAFAGLSRRSRFRSSARSGFGIEIKYRSTPFYPQPLPGIDEEKLIRVRQCSGCTLRYAVFGEHRYCAVCGPLPADVVALDALAAETIRLDVLGQLPGATVATLRERGVYTRIWIDTLENLVSLTETLASAVFHAAIIDAAGRVRGRGNVFQRLDDTAELFVAADYPDLRTVLDPPTWQRLQRIWGARHLFTHNDGIVDDQYLAKIPNSTAQVGQRLTITEQMCRQAILDTEVLCRSIASMIQ